MAFEFDLLAPALPILLGGMRTTGLVILTAFPLGLMVGMAAAYCAECRTSALRRTALAYVELVRNIPFLILVYVGFFGLPKLGLSMSAFTVGVVAITLHTGGYFCEIMRAGFRSLPRGQIEAARSLGLSSVQTQWCVVLPQVLPVVGPGTINLAIQTLKESAVLSVIGLKELTYQSQVITADTFAFVEIFCLTALLYWLSSIILEAFGQLVEHRLSHWKRR
jgi:polar amino acid transport system permease protein